MCPGVTVVAVAREGYLCGWLRVAPAGLTLPERPLSQSGPPAPAPALRHSPTTIGPSSF
nr:MAG TPA: hypothetical protein [Bacteriophage sp.]